MGTGDEAFVQAQSLSDHLGGFFWGEKFLCFYSIQEIQMYREQPTEMSDKLNEKKKKLAWFVSMCPFRGKGPVKINTKFF